MNVYLYLNEEILNLYMDYIQAFDMLFFEYS